MHIKEKSDDLSFYIKKRQYDQTAFGSKAVSNIEEKNIFNHNTNKSQAQVKENLSRARAVTSDEQYLFEKLLMDEQSSDKDVDESSDESVSLCNPFGVYDTPRKGDYSDSSKQVKVIQEQKKELTVTSSDSTPSKSLTNSVGSKDQEFELDIESRDFSAIKLKGIKDNSEWHVTVTLSSDKAVEWFKSKKDIIERSLSKRFECKINLMVNNDQ